MKLLSQNSSRWDRFQNQYYEFNDLKLRLDLSRIQWTQEFLEGNVPRGKMELAFKEMAELENGGISNKDEGRQVGHYWLRNPELAPSMEVREAIISSQAKVENFAARILNGELVGSGGKFRNYILIGIGGSALGPQLVSKALRNEKSNGLKGYFFDNTDPEGILSILSSLKKELGQTICIVISKSGSTKETRNGMLEARNAYESLSLDWSKHAVAVTCEDSALDQLAQSESWLDRFPMWDWVGGRTSVFSPVGLLPAALEAIPVREMLEGARMADVQTRIPEIDSNPSALLALTWYFEGNGQGAKDMVVLPYRDRLELFSKYLQQLVMESLGKELDRDGNTVLQGIAVYGNKGSTDQHAYVQQLREGLHNFFVTFIETLRDPESPAIEVEPGVTTGDYLSGFFLGTREALSEKDRESATITIDELNPFALGVLIALYERTVGLYASLVNINAYHQPGVEAGKKAAGKVIQLQQSILDALQKNPDKFLTVKEILGLVDHSEAPEEWIYKILERFSLNPSRKVEAGEDNLSLNFEQRTFRSKIH